MTSHGQILPAWVQAHTTDLVQAQEEAKPGRVVPVYFTNIGSQREGHERGGKATMERQDKYVPQYFCLYRRGDHIRKLSGKDGRSEPCPGKPHLQVCLFHPLCHTSQSVLQSDLPHHQHIWHPCV